jgi:tetratricopeptide (TPR) repeat protein
MISDPYLFFAEVSLAISRGKFQAGIDQLEPFSGQFTDSYLFHLLYGKALKGIRYNTLASEYFRKCCAIAPANQIAWQELIELQASAERDEAGSLSPLFDAVTDELEKLTAALMKFEPVKTSENADPTSILEQKKPFSDDTTIAVPTESLANLFTAQGAYKKAIKIYTHLIQLKPHNAELYQHEIDALLDLL